MKQVTHVTHKVSSGAIHSPWSHEQVNFYILWENAFFFLSRLNKLQYEKHMLHCYDIMFTQMFVYMHIFIHNLLPKSSYINAYNVCSMAQDNY